MPPAIEAMQLPFKGPRLQQLTAQVLKALADAHAVAIPQHGGSAGSEDERAAKRRIRVAVHGDMRDANVLIRMPMEQASAHGGSSSMGAAGGQGGSSEGSGMGPMPTEIKFIDFDTAGCAGEAIYPPFLNPALPWPAGAHAGAVITQQHDRQLLSASMQGAKGSHVWPWQTDPAQPDG